MQGIGASAGKVTARSGRSCALASSSRAGVPSSPFKKPLPGSDLLAVACPCVKSDVGNPVESGFRGVKRPRRPSKRPFQDLTCGQWHAWVPSQMLATPFKVVSEVLRGHRRPSKRPFQDLMVPSQMLATPFKVVSEALRGPCGAFKRALSGSDLRSVACPGVKSDVGNPVAQSRVSMASALEGLSAVMALVVTVRILMSGVSFARLSKPVPCKRIAPHLGLAWPLG